MTQANESAASTPQTVAIKPVAPVVKSQGWIKWIFTGFGFFRKAKPDEAVCYALDKGFFLWAAILVGLISSLIVRYAPSTAVVCGWIYALVLIYTLVMLLSELDTWKCIFWGGTIVLIYLLFRYPLGWMGIVPGIGRYLSNLKPALDPKFAEFMSIGMGILFVGSIYHCLANGRKVVTPNSIEEWHFLKGSEIQDRGGLRFRTNYRDLLETILGFGAGDLVAYDRANRVVKRYENVFGLFFKWNKLDKILHQRFALVDNVANDAVDVQIDTLHAADDNQTT